LSKKLKLIGNDEFNHLINISTTLPHVWAQIFPQQVRPKHGIRLVETINYLIWY